MCVHMLISLLVWWNSYILVRVIDSFVVQTKCASHQTTNVRGRQRERMSVCVSRLQQSHIHSKCAISTNAREYSMCFGVDCCRMLTPRSLSPSPFNDFSLIFDSIRVDPTNQPTDQGDDDCLSSLLITFEARNHSILLKLPFQTLSVLA